MQCITVVSESYNEREVLSEMFAIIVTGGKQYKVEEGDVVFVEKLEANEGEEVTFDTVLAVSGETFVAGAPTVEGASVTAKVLKNGKGKMTDYDDFDDHYKEV